MIIYTQKLIVVHGSEFPASTRVNIHISCRANIVWAALHFLAPNMSLVGCCLLVVFLVTGDQINADVQTFHQMLANFSTGHHLPTQANLTSDGHSASDTLVKDMKSRIYAIIRVTGIYATSQVTGIWAISQVTGICQ